MDRSVDDLATPLHEVTFCVVDLETTGASAATCAITEVGAARFRGGECLGTFQTLVDAGVPVDPGVTALTGITDPMLRGCPSVESVLPALAEFASGTVLVGHNVRFDIAFLDAALGAADRATIGARVVDTLALARRTLRDEPPDLRLGTLADLLALPHRPSHRALDDALATADLLHALLERLAGLGVVVLDDLLEVPRLAPHAPASKLRLTTHLPRGPGVYVLRDAQGAPLAVEAAGDVRRAVRDLFGADPGRGVRHLLRTVHAVDHEACATATEAAQRAGELAAELLPPRRRRARRREAEVGLRCAAC